MGFPPFIYPLLASKTGRGLEAQSCDILPKSEAVFIVPVPENNTPLGC